MKIQLHHKKALVGGSTQGLGKAIAYQLAECGATVTLMARNTAKLQQVLQQLPTPNQQQHQYLQVDFADFESFKPSITEYFAANTVDILVNNTNGPSAGNIFSKVDTDYQAAFNLLFQSVNYTTMLALKGMQQQQFGRIINLSSSTVKEPLANLVLSNTIRAAVIGWAKTLAREVAKDGITVNNILTGYFDTERIHQIIALQAEANGVTAATWQHKMEQEIPMQRLGKPEEFGQLVAFLASDFAAYITGTNIPLDGGLLKSI